MVTDALPVFVIVNVCDLVCPSTTLPNAKLEGAMFRLPWTPVPLNVIVRGDPLASLLTLILPVTLPPEVGAKTTFIVTAAEGFSVHGKAIPFTLNPAPVALMLEI